MVGHKPLDTSLPEQSTFPVKKPEQNQKCCNDAMDDKKQIYHYCM